LGDLEDAKRQHAKSVERFVHLQALLDLERSNAASGRLDPKPASDGQPTGGDRQAVDVAAAVLAERNEAMHYREIYGEL